VKRRAVGCRWTNESVFGWLHLSSISRVSTADTSHSWCLCWLLKLTTVNNESEVHAASVTVTGDNSNRTSSSHTWAISCADPSRMTWVLLGLSLSQLAFSQTWQGWDTRWLELLPVVHTDTVASRQRTDVAQWCWTAEPTEIYDDDYIHAHLKTFTVKLLLTPLASIRTVSLNHPAPIWDRRSLETRHLLKPGQNSRLL